MTRGRPHPGPEPAGWVRRAGARLRGAGAVRARGARASAPPPDAAVPPVDSVLEWARNHRAPATVITPASQRPKPPPHTIEPDIHPKFTESDELRFAARYVATVSRARVELPPHAAWPPGNPRRRDCPRVVLPDDAIALESTQFLLKPYRPRPRAVAVPVPGDHVSLLSPHAWPPNHYHWLHDVLTSLHGVGPHLPAGTRYLVPPALGARREESLAMLGIGTDQLVAFDLGSADCAHPAWELERLHFSPGPVGPCAAPEALEWLRGVALAYASATGRTPHRRLYISRRTARYRRAVNEAEVLALLTSRGFECHELDEYTLRDQIALFSEAAVIVGPHGAGHTNMLFAPPGLVVVDILGREVNKCFHHLAVTLGHDYWYFTGDDVTSGDRYTDDIRVPLDALAATLERALPDD